MRLDELKSFLLFARRRRVNLTDHFGAVSGESLHALVDAFNRQDDPAQRARDRLHVEEGRGGVQQLLPVPGPNPDPCTCRGAATCASCVRSIERMRVDRGQPSPYSDDWLRRDPNYTRRL